MKKIFLTFLAIGGLLFTAYAQEISEHAIGLRFGNNDGIGAEISYQKALGENNRLELDFGWRNANNWDGFRFTGLYQWVLNINNGFNWYLGAGGGLGSYKWNETQANGEDREVFLFAAGDLGVEYNFGIPLLISFDVRPELGFGSSIFNNDDLDLDIALGIRYQF